jgi:hypothetical protein
VLYYDEFRNKWVQVEPQGPRPKPRSGHLMFCYYQYLIVFGGHGHEQAPYGDLWVFDTINEEWHMIMDSNDVHTLTHQNIQGIIPTARVYAGGVINERFGAAFITGGRTTQGPACDMWTLDVEKTIMFIEQPDEYVFENIWHRDDVAENQDLFCRWGHATGFVNTRYMFIYGGVNNDGMVVRESFLFDMIDRDYIVKLTEEGDTPSVRMTFSNLLAAGNGMMTLYGGEDAGHKGHFTDIWHLRIHVEKAHVDFTKIDYKKGAHEH